MCQSAVLGREHHALVVQPAHIHAFVRYRPAQVVAGTLQATVDTTERGLGLVVEAIMPDMRARERECALERDAGRLRRDRPAQEQTKFVLRGVNVSIRGACPIGDPWRGT